MDYRADEDWLKIREVARILQCDVMNVEQWIKAGKLQDTKVGRIRRVSRKALQDFKLKRAEESLNSLSKDE